MKYMLLALVVLPFVIGCASTPQERRYQQQVWGNTFQSMGTNLMHSTNHPSEKYVYKDSMGQKVGTVERAYY